MRRALLLVVLACAAVAVLGGCTRARTVTRTEVVEVRVPIPVEAPAPPLLVRPALPIAELAPSSTDGEVARAYLATVVLLQLYAAELEALLDAYRPAPAAAPPDRWPAARPPSTSARRVQIGPSPLPRPAPQR